MPRSPEGVYTKPPGTNGGPPNTPISSTAYNNLMNDLAQDANTPRPVAAGGTGSNTAIGGLDNLHTASVPIPASAMTDLSGASGVSVLITGNSDIEEFGDVHAGAVRILTFEDDLTILYDDEDPKVILPAAASYQVTAGEVITLLSDGGGVWRILSSSTGAGSKTRFLAHKNGVNQPVVINSAKITFGTEAYDDGGYYDAANSRWTPPAGRHYVSVAFTGRQTTNPTGTVALTLELRKNDVAYARGFTTVQGANFVVQATLSRPIEANGTDYFEIWGVNENGNYSGDIRGAVVETWFSAHAI